ncbi:MAG TPA: malto-oligosyltrehalose trehalohydrolase [Bryobacteraceae bacterium]|nr:malto-oligosyltrehalose trehalohydrolase [Bryobacteraceae bacterium]
MPQPIANANSSNVLRNIPVGAEFSVEAGGTHFRVWAPERQSVSVTFEDAHEPAALTREDNGYFSGFAAGILAGTKYKYQLDGGESYPDPASRYQPTGPHGFSAVVDPQTFPWSDENWLGAKLPGQVIYELHLGTFTPEGTWKAAAGKLEFLQETGITLIEIMPVADFPGKFGWGYDGVQPFAPASIYGRPGNMRAFVDKAHALRIGVILDVVYNHLGPEGNYLTKFSPFYLSRKHKTDWGQGLNFDGEHSRPVREFFRENAAYWIREFHLDGLRFDATQNIYDESGPHVLMEIGEAARLAAGQRSIVLVGENEPQETRLITSIKDGGFGLDALWNDDFHHSAMVALTGQSDAYYSDYRGTPQELLSGIKYGYLFQGQWYRWQKKRRGHSTLGLPRASMINFIQNHDQVANSARGQRLHQLTAPGTYKAITALTLLAPGTPMLFQGQEFGASGPFLFFADHNRELSKTIKQGREKFLSQWRALGTPEMRRSFADPAALSTFERSRLDHSESWKHLQLYHLHRDLLRLRREDAVISRQGAEGIDGAVLSASCFVLRYFSPGYKNDRLLLVNLGVELELNPSPEPLLGPPERKAWKTLWSTEDPQYGGCGVIESDSDENWRIPAHAAVVLHPVMAHE